MQRQFPRLAKLRLEDEQTTAGEIDMAALERERLATLFGDEEGEKVALRWGVAVPRIKKR